MYEPMQQQKFAGRDQTHEKEVTRLKNVLTEMDAVLPCLRPEGLIAPHCPKPRAGAPKCRPLSPAAELRNYRQKFCGPSNSGADEVPYDTDATRCFLGITMTDDPVPDVGTILQSRCLEWYGLAEQISTEVTIPLRKSGLMLRAGTPIETTLIHAPSLMNAHCRNGEEISFRRR